MDPEVQGLLSQLDAIINGLAANPQISVDKLKQLQRERAALDTQVADFKGEIERRMAEFKRSMQSKIESFTRRAANPT